MNRNTRKHQRRTTSVAALVLFVLGSTCVLQAGVTRKASYGDPALGLGRLGQLGKHHPAVSTDGMVVAFESIQSQETPLGGVYVYDFASGQLDIVAPEGLQPSISADGRFVAYWKSRKVYLFDRQLGATLEIQESYGIHRPTSLSADGRYVAFAREYELVVFDQTTALTDEFSFQSSPGLEYDFYSHPSISADGRYVAFACRRSSGQPPDPVQRKHLVFVWDRDTDDAILASVDSAGAEADGNSAHPAIAADGGFVVFESTADNLVADDSGSCRDIFIRWLPDGPTERLSVDSAGVEADRPSYAPAVSADGPYVSFHSFATNLVPDDTNESADVFIRDLQEDDTTRVSLSSAGSEGDLSSMRPAVSGDGQYVVFSSLADNLVPDDCNAAWDILRRDRLTGQTQVTAAVWAFTQTNGWSEAPSISADGRYLAWSGYSSNHLAMEDNGSCDVFIFDSQSGQMTLVTQGHDGSPANGNSFDPVIAADGGHVVFTSEASNLVPGDDNGYWDVFVCDLQSGQMTVASVNNVGQQPDRNSVALDISADGQVVLFHSEANNMSDEPGIYVREAGVTTFIAAAPGNGCWHPEYEHAELSADARYVAYARVYPSWDEQLLVYDRQDDEEELIYDGEARWPSISDDGRFVAFVSDDEVVPGTPDRANIFLYDRQLGVYELMSDFDEPCDYVWTCDAPVMAGDASAVAFLAYCYTSLPDVNVYVRERAGDAPVLVSVNRFGEPANGMCERPALSADGRYVAFASAADNLAAGDRNGFTDIFVRDRSGCLGDLNDDRVVNVNDFAILAGAFRSRFAQPNYLPVADLDSNGVVDVTDFVLLALGYGSPCP